MNNVFEKTCVIIKPDGMEPLILREILKRINIEDLSIIEFKILRLSDKIIDEHYQNIINEEYYATLKEYMMSGYVAVLIVYGRNAIAKMRKLIGHTDSRLAMPGTIRGDFGNKINIERNVIHASDSSETAETEIKRFFNNENSISNCGTIILEEINDKSDLIEKVKLLEKSKNRNFSDAI